MKRGLVGGGLCFGIMVFVQVVQSQEPVPKDELKMIQARYTAQENAASARLKRNSDDISAYSARGDARLFLGNFEGSRKDYEKMIQLNPKLDVSHWRLGIAYFYLKDYDKAARQFKIYHNYDQVDRENGIWRFMSQYKASGLAAARKGLLKYEKDDRPPYPWLYDVFAGKTQPERVFSKIEEEAFDDRYKTRVLFHAYLYIGIYLELTEGSAKALPYLSKAAANAYGRATGTYMWQVARIHYRLSSEGAKEGAESDGQVSPPN
jgi:lipoprotein NlpI